MTEKEFLNLEEFEQSKLVAEHVFGYTVQETVLSKNPELILCTIGEPEFIAIRSGEGYKLTNELENYADDLNSAWKVLDHFRRRYEPNSSFLWKIEARRYDYVVKLVDPSGKNKDICAKHPKASKAICLAALKLLDVVKD